MGEKENFIQEEGQKKQEQQQQQKLEDLCGKHSVELEGRLCQRDIGNQNQITGNVGYSLRVGNRFHGLGKLVKLRTEEI